MPNKVFLTEKSHTTDFLKLLAKQGLSFEDALAVLGAMDEAGFQVVKNAPPGTRASRDADDE